MRMQKSFSFTLLFLLLIQGGFTPLFSQQRQLDREALMEAALKNNREFLQAKIRDRQAEAKARAARGSRLPDVEFSSQLSWSLSPQAYTIQEGDLYSGYISPGVEFNLPEEDYTVEFSGTRNYDFSLTLEQPLFTWGRIENSIRAADLGKIAAEILLEKKIRETGTRLDILLATLTRLSEMEALLEEQEVTARRLKSLSEESFDNGFLLQSDLMSVRLLTREAELAKYRMEEQRSQALLSLKTLTGLQDLRGENLVLTEAKPRADYRLEDREVLAARGLSQSPDIQLLSVQARAAEKQAAIAKGESYAKPDLGLYVQFSYAGSAFPLLEQNWQKINKGNIISTLGIRTTLFDGGEIRGQIRQKEEELVWARLEQEKGAEALSEYIRMSLYKIELARQNLDYLDLQILTDEARREQKENAWKAGYGEEREVLTEELAWYSHRINRIQEELNLTVLELNLENALGGE